ncbi:hypothetical protein K227x_19310 [Rubripirellula lacrimiformis]|uniref:Uncharacterized protein n=1 Tax=Rubripirellula lacrimiformis TaxID=1930273 RepID=A0A517N8U2_9BACT|nr:hypothetical protein K227x_19310 [Rubripirellula lacrimiformis]
MVGERVTERPQSTLFGPLTPALSPRSLSKLHFDEIRGRGGKQMVGERVTERPQSTLFGPLSPALNASSARFRRGGEGWGEGGALYQRKQASSLSGYSPAENSDVQMNFVGNPTVG